MLLAIPPNPTKTLSTLCSKSFVPFKKTSLTILKETVSKEEAPCSLKYINSLFSSMIAKAVLVPPPSIPK